MPRQTDAAKSPEESEWLTLEDAVAYLKVSRPTIYRLCRGGQLRYYKLAGVGARRFRRADLDRLLLPDTSGGAQAGPATRFSMASLQNAIRASEGILKGRRFPDDSVDLIDEARRERAREL